MTSTLRLVFIPLLAVMVAGCQPGPTNRPVPSVNQIGADLKCPQGDHPFEDIQAGWGFCYPGTWKYNVRANTSASPRGLDIGFDITDVPCTSPSPVPGQGSPRPVCSAGAGLFAYMIISTYERGDSTSLAGWIQTNLSFTTATGARVPGPAFQPIAWGNAVEAGRFKDGRRIALTEHHVVVLDLRAGSGNLDLESNMSVRLDTWKFSF